MNKIKGLILFWFALVGTAVSVQGTNWPSTINSDSNLYIAKNNCGAVLSAAITSGATTISVNDTTCFPTVGYITFDEEAALCTGKTATTFTGCTRGADDTTAAAHAIGSAVGHFVIADHHNVLKDELIAMTTYFFQGSDVHIDTTTSPAQFGLGTAAPTAHLSVWGTGSSNTVSFSTNTSGTPTAFVISNAGVITAGPITATSITDSSLTSGRIPYAGTGGLLQDDPDLLFNGSTVTTPAIILNKTGTATAVVTGYPSYDLEMDASGWSTVSTAAVNVSATLRLRAAFDRADGEINRSVELHDYKDSTNSGFLSASTKVLEYDLANREFTIWGQDEGSGAMLNIRNRADGSAWIRFFKNDGVDTGTTSYSKTWQIGVNGWDETNKFTIIQDNQFDAMVISEDGKWIIGKLPLNTWQEISKSSFIARVWIKGYVDEPQFIVQASTGQTVSTFRVVNSSTATLFEVDANGNTNLVDHILYGSGNSGNPLKLQSTTHATKGKILFGSAETTAYDETNDWFGVGTASPGYPLQVTSTATTTIARFNKGGNYIDIGGAGSGTIYFGGFEGAMAVYNIFGSGTLGLGAGGNTDDIFISAGHSVGIGNSSPSTKLHMSSGVFTQDGTTAYHTFAMNTTTPTAVAGQASIWAVDVGGSAEMKVIDGAGNVTQISPHDPVTGGWVFSSHNLNTGRNVRVDMERFIKAVEKLTGDVFWEESYNEVPKAKQKSRKRKR